ncbi:glycosyltransferase [Flavobacterium capsici]|uniref:Glycosyltransferase n=1 Tax=Flavobacterium capsici TaxID=3075618 RepID=A0AA96F0L6_9FLAO|nr:MULTISPECIES: glycosyltransferase [unclassified Flavobacterium]WNM20229.1 glycosyltransferase [Flavobacterium sp. PMR2A8]WNM21619.1 glycosyltransferase [Flavobacterium sp. PMTSA4]
MIVFFLPDLRAGGAERVMLNVLLKYHLAFPEESVVLLLGKKEGPLLAEIPSTIPIYSLEASNATRSIRPLIRFCKKHHPKVVFSTLGSALAASIAKNFVSSKIIFINRIGNTIGAEKMLIDNRIKRALYLLANKIIAKNSDHILFQCKYMVEDFIFETGMQPKKYNYIYNPVQIDRIEKLIFEEVKETYTFISVGRLNPQKDYETLLKSCVILKERNIKFKLGIIGEGPLKKDLQEKIKVLNLEDCVHLIGFLPNPYPYMKEAKYLVSSSLYEGFSNVIIESLCLGTPVIATNCPGGNAEVLVEGKNGFLCNVNDAEDLASIMEKGINESDKFDNKNIANDAKVLFNMETIFKQYVKVLKNNIE